MVNKPYGGTQKFIQSLPTYVYVPNEGTLSAIEHIKNSNFG